MPRPEAHRAAFLDRGAARLGGCAARLGDSAACWGDYDGHVCRRGSILFLLVALAVASTAAWAQQQVPPSVLPARPAQKEEPEWWKAEKELTALLKQPGASLTALVQQFGESKPTTGQEAMFRLCIFGRAGMDKEAIQSLHDLKRLCPGLSGSQPYLLYYDACDKMHDWEIAQAVADIFADSIHGIELELRLEKHLLKTGWTVDRIDEWLAAKPAGHDNFWVKERLRFNTQRGRGAALQAQLADRVRARPDDAAEAITFLDALIFAHGDPKSLDLAWMAQIVKPRLATDAQTIALRFVQLKDPASAVVFFRQAIDIPLTPVDVANLTRKTAALLPESEIREIFSVGVREELASCLVSCLLKTDQAADAEKWLLEAAELGEKKMVRDRLLTDRVPAEAGQREIAPIGPQDADSWQWLENRPEWERLEERLLRRMIGGRSGKEGEATLARAEKLALAGNASRAFTLATVERTLHLPTRSIPLLTYAAEHAQNDELKGRIHWALFNSYLDLGDWKHAEEAIAACSQGWKPKEMADGYARLAVAAARAGAKADAMRFWKQAVKSKIAPHVLGDS